MKLAALVTGGTGFIGTHLSRRLIKEGYDVTVTQLTQDEPVPEGCEVLDWKFLVSSQALPKFDVCFHQAAHNDTQCLDSDQIFNANVREPSLLFEKLFQAGCKHFIFASSTAVYGNAQVPYIEDMTLPNPLTPYALSKLKFERFCRIFCSIKNQVNMIGLRYCNVYGPGEERKGHRSSMIGQILRTALQNAPIKLFRDGNQERDWIYIDDVVRANLSALNIINTEPFFGTCPIFNVGTGKSHSFREIILHVESCTQQRMMIDWIDCPFPETYQSQTCCDVRWAKSRLNFESHISLKCGIEDYYKHLVSKNV